MKTINIKNTHNAFSGWYVPEYDVLLKFSYAWHSEFLENYFYASTPHPMSNPLLEKIIKEAREKLKDDILHLNANTEVFYKLGWVRINVFEGFGTISCKGQFSEIYELLKNVKNNMPMGCRLDNGNIYESIDDVSGIDNYEDFVSEVRMNRAASKLYSKVMIRNRLDKIVRKICAYQSWEQYRKDHENTKFKSKSEYEDALGIKDEKGVKKAPAKSEFFDENIMALPKDTQQKNVKSKEDFYKGANEAQNHMLEWLDKGKGIQKEIGAKHFDVKSKEDFDGMLEDLDKTKGPFLITAPLKGEKRATEKVNSDYNGDWSQLMDGVRATIAIDNFDDIDGVVKTLHKSGMKLAKRPKDRFASPTVAGYRDILLNVEYPNGHIGELQINTKSMIKAKEKDGHKLYEKSRSLMVKAHSEGREEMDDSEIEQAAELYSEMRDLYDSAWHESSNKKENKKEDNGEVKKENTNKKTNQAVDSDGSIGDMPKPILTEKGSLVSGTSHIWQTEGTSYFLKDTLIPSVTKHAGEFLKKNPKKKVVFLYEGGMIYENQLNEDWAKDNEQAQVAKGLKKDFGSKVDLDTWDDENTEPYERDGDNQKFYGDNDARKIDVENTVAGKKLVKQFGGNKDLVEASLYADLAGEEDVLVEPSDGAKKVLKDMGIDIKDKKSLLDAAWPENGKPSSDVSKVVSAWSRLRNENMLKKIKDVESAGNIAIVTPGADHINEIRRDKLAKRRITMAKIMTANKTKYFELDDRPCIWEYKKFPKKYITQSKYKVVYDFFQFFNDASEITQKIYEDMLQNLPE